MTAEKGQKIGVRPPELQIQERNKLVHPTIIARPLTEGTRLLWLGVLAT